MTEQPKSGQNQKSHKLKELTDGEAYLEDSGPSLLEVIFSSCKNVVRSLCLKNLRSKEATKPIRFERSFFVCLASRQINSSKVTQHLFMSLFKK